MNKNDRKQIDEWIDQLEEIKSGIEVMQENEQEKLENLPEGIQFGERGDKMSAAIENLEYAASSIGEAIDYLNDAME